MRQDRVERLFSPVCLKILNLLLLVFCFVGCSNFSEKKIVKKPDLRGVYNPPKTSELKPCIMVGKIKDFSDPLSFPNLKKEIIGRRSIYGQLSPFRFKDIELSVTDAAIKKYGNFDVPQLLDKFDCDFYITGEILEFSNRFFVAYSITEIVMRLELFDRQGQIIWSGTERTKSDAGAIPLTPVGAVTGIFFASKNRKEEVAIQVLSSVSRKLIENLVQYLDVNYVVEKKLNTIASSKNRNSRFGKSDLREAIDLRNYDQAKLIASQLLAQNENDSELLFLSGKIDLAEEQFKSAKAYFAKAIAIDDIQSDYFSGLAIANLRLGEENKAASNFEKALVLNEKNVSAHMGLAFIYENQNSIDKSGQHLYDAGLFLISNSDYPSAVYALSELERLVKKNHGLIEKKSALEALIKFNRDAIK